jgi:DnaK suppressor protein
MEQPELDDAERDVDDVEHVLRRLDDGTYGTCEVCGEPIGDELLRDDPARRTCAAH